MKIIDVKHFSDTEKIYTILVSPQEEVPYGKALPKDMATGSKMKVVGSDVEWTYSKNYDEDFVHESWTSPLSPIGIANIDGSFTQVPSGSNAEIIGEGLAEAFLNSVNLPFVIVNGSGYDLGFNSLNMPSSRSVAIVDAYYQRSTYTPQLQEGDFCDFTFLLRLASTTVEDDSVYFIQPHFITELYEKGSFYVDSYLSSGNIREIGNGVMVPYTMTALVSNQQPG